MKNNHSLTHFSVTNNFVSYGNEETRAPPKLIKLLKTGNVCLVTFHVIIFF